MRIFSCVLPAALAAVLAGALGSTASAHAPDMLAGSNAGSACSINLTKRGLALDGCLFAAWKHRCQITVVNAHYVDMRNCAVSRE